jgi:hypothetical protein
MSDRARVDAALVTAVGSGDEQALGRLIARHHPAVARFAAVVAGPEVGEKVALDAWRSFFDRLPAIASPAAGAGRAEIDVRAELLGIVADALPDVSTELATRERIDPERFFEDEHPRWAGSWAQPPRPWTSGVDDAARVRLVTDALAVLRPWSGAAVVLRDVEAMTVDEAAVVLRISTGEFRQLLADGRIGIWRWLDQRLEKGHVAR